LGFTKILIENWTHGNSNVDTIIDFFERSLIEIENGNWDVHKSWKIEFMTK